MKFGTVTHNKTDASMITKLDIQMFHDESWKPIYFGIKKSKVKVTNHRNNAFLSCECCFLVVLWFWLQLLYACCVLIYGTVVY